jgi:hypothetical protein
VDARGRGSGPHKSSSTARKPIVIKPRRELRRQGQFSCPRCKAVHPLADLRKCCGACSQCCACSRASTAERSQPNLP